jgi:hypothetical protein
MKQWQWSGHLKLVENAPIKTLVAGEASLLFTTIWSIEACLRLYYQEKCDNWSGEPYMCNHFFCSCQIIVKTKFVYDIWWWKTIKKVSIVNLSLTIKIMFNDRTHFGKRFIMTLMSVVLKDCAHSKWVCLPTFMHTYGITFSKQQIIEQWCSK